MDHSKFYLLKIPHLTPGKSYLPIIKYNSNEKSNWSRFEHFSK